MDAVKSHHCLSLKHTRVAFFLIGGMMDENDAPRLRPYPQHPPKSLDALSTKLIDNGLSGVSSELLERRIEQVGYFRLKGVTTSNCICSSLPTTALLSYFATHCCAAVPLPA